MTLSTGSTVFLPDGRRGLILGWRGPWTAIVLFDDDSCEEWAVDELRLPSKGRQAP